jgi:hypothetical protein
MNKKYISLLLLLFMIFPAILFSQILNPGFEQWPAGNPSGWLTTNFIGIGTPVYPVSSGHSGEAALKGEVITIISGDTLIPLIISGQFGEGFTVSEQHGALTGYYKFSPVSGDNLVIIILMYNNSNVVGSGALYIPTTTSAFTQFTVPIDYFAADVPDNCIIQFTIDNPQAGLPHPGSYYIIDDLAFSAATGIDTELVSGIPSAFELQQNYPNPFNPVTQIRYALPQAGLVQLEVYNSLGQKIAELVNEYQSAGNHIKEFQAGSLPSGIYFYRITAGSYQKMLKMMLVK